MSDWASRWREATDGLADLEEKYSVAADIEADQLSIEIGHADRQVKEIAAEIANHPTETLNDACLKLNIVTEISDKHTLKRLRGSIVKRLAEGVKTYMVSS